MRKDKKENQIKVLKEIIENPLQSQRDIAENTGIGKSSVNRAIIEMGQNGTFEEPEVIDFVKLDLELQGLTTKEMIRRVKYETKEVDNQSLTRFNDTSFKRSQILQSKPTEVIDVNIKDVAKMTDEEIQEYVKTKLALQYK